MARKPAVKPFDIAKERWNEAAEVAPGFWIIATHHRPGGSRHMPEINNRCLILRLKDADDEGKQVLVVINAVDPVAIAEVKRIETEKKTPVRYILSPGGGHNLNLVDWHDAFPEAKILVGPKRIPRVAAGRKLAASSRFAAFDNDDPMPQFHGQVEFVNFDGILAFREGLTPKEGARDTLLNTFKFLLTEMPPRDPTDELWLYHVPTRTIFGGENLNWILSREQFKSMPLMLRLMGKPETVGARKVADKPRVAANWRKILGWPAENLFSYHDTIGTGQVGGAQAALQAAVEKSGQLGG